MGLRVLHDREVAVIYSSVSEQPFGRIIHPVSHLGLDAAQVAVLILKLDKAGFLSKEHPARADVVFMDAAYEEIRQLKLDGYAWDLWLHDDMEWPDKVAERVLEKAKDSCGLP
jgi:hypothetical protein